MKYLIGYFSEEDASSRSEEIATEQGCFGDTKYWFGVGKHYDINEWCLIIPEGEENKLTAEEQVVLKTEEELAQNNWFPPPLH